MARGKANRRRKPARAPRRLPRINWRALLLLPAGAVLAALMFFTTTRLLDQPVRALVISGSFQRVTALQVEEALAGDLSQGFFSADLEALCDRVEALEWVQHAEIQRRWPDTLAVRVVEHVAAARWGEGGLLNTSGELFTRETRHLFPELPQLSGPPGSESRVARTYLSLRGRLAEAGLALTELALDERGAWRFLLDDGTEVRLGRRETGPRMERFFAVVVPQLRPRFNDIEYVDLRYSNGFAVGWYPAADPDALLAGQGGTRG
jgi:cell division protein FtsQ